MYFHNNFKTLSGLFGLVFVLTACSSAPFPEVVGEEDYATYSSEESNFDVPVHKKVLKESSSLGADNENVAYEGQGKAMPKSKGHEKISAAKTSSISKKDLSDEMSEKDNRSNNLKDSSSREKFEREQANVDVSTPSVTYLVGTIYFNNGSSAVDGSYSRQLREIVKLAKSNKATINVYGYASSRTRNTDIVNHKLANFKVSSARAENVAAALKRAGLQANKIKTEALSDSNPAYLEVMPEGERLNRRAEIYISY